MANISKEVTSVFSCLSRYSAFFTKELSENKKIASKLIKFSNNMAENTYDAREEVYDFREDSDKRFDHVTKDKDEFMANFITICQHKKELNAYIYKFNVYNRKFDDLREDYQKVIDSIEAKRIIAKNNIEVSFAVSCRRVISRIESEKDIIDTISSRLSSIVDDD